MSTVVCNHHEESVETDTFPLLSFPNEIIEKVISKLNKEDRIIISSIDDRFHSFEKRAGYRHFTLIEARLKSGITEVFSADCTMILNTASELEIAEFYRHATTDRLHIQGEIDSITERRLTVAFKTVMFQKLNVNLSGEHSSRVIGELVRSRRSIDAVQIIWSDLAKNPERAKKVLMHLPSMGRCRIIAADHIQLIDDDILLHLVSNCTTTQLDSTNTTLSARGLETAFEVLSNSRNTSAISFYAPANAIQRLFRQLDGRFVVEGNRVKHIESGAVLLAGTTFPGQDSCFVSMLVRRSQ